MTRKSWGWCSLAHIKLRFFCDGEFVNKKTKTQKKIDGDNHVYSLDMLLSVGSFRELEYDTYLTCCFMQFLFELEIIFVYLALWVDFVISCTEKSKAIHV